MAAAGTDFVQVFESGLGGLPRLRTYFSELWARRAFATELSRATLKAENSDTAIGQLWLLLNPLLQAGVYYMLVFILSSGKNRGHDYLAHLLAGIFAFTFLQGAMASGAVAVTSARNLVLNTPFPRLLLVIAAMRTNFRRFLPTVPIFLIAYFLSGGRLKWEQLLAIPAFVLLAGFSFGLCALLATMQVFFRDTVGLLPFVSRMWLYISPVLYYAEDVPSRFRIIQPVNPLYPLLGAWGDTAVRGAVPTVHVWLAGAAWAVAVLLLGTWAFMSRESDFAVRV